MADTREDRIRQRAHLLWEAAGQPEGDDAAHWHQAEAEIDAAGAATPPIVDITPATPEPAPETPKPAKPAVRKPRAAPKPRTPKKA